LIVWSLNGDRLGIAPTDHASPAATRPAPPSVRGVAGSGGSRVAYPFVIPYRGVADLFDLDQLNEEDPFEIDTQASHLFKHAGLGVEDIYDVWQSNPVFYPAKPPAHWLMVAEVHGVVLMVPLAPSDSNDPTRCRPIGCYIPAKHLIDRYLEDR
jgi:hypothetical protein